MAEHALSHLSPDLAKFRLLAPRKILWVQIHAGSHSGSLKDDLIPNLISSPTSCIPLLPQGLGRKWGSQGRSAGEPLSTGKTPCLYFWGPRIPAQSPETFFTQLPRPGISIPGASTAPCYANVGK